MTHSTLTGIDVFGAVVEGVISSVVCRVDAGICFGLCKVISQKAHELAIDRVTF